MNDSVLFVLPNDKLGGAEQILQMLAIHFHSQYKIIHVIFLKKETYHHWVDLPPNIVLYFANSSSEKGGIFFLINQIRLILKKDNLVYTFSSHTHINSFLGLLRKFRILKTKHLIVRESTLIFQRFNGLKLFVFRLLYILGYGFTDLVICSTSLMKIELLKNIPKSKNWNIKVIQSPIDIEKLDQLSLDNSFDLYYNRKEFIIAAGRLIKIKGFDLLIDAFALIANKFPYLSLIILGDGEEKNNLQKQILDLGLESRIVLFGFVENPIPFFKKAKACVVSSLIEGFPNILLQMMSQNDRIVSTSCADGVNKINGLFLSPPNNVDALAKQIQLALEIKDSSNIRVSFDSYLKDRTTNNYIDLLFSSLQD